MEDIQTLNEWALEGRLEVTAISLARVSARTGQLRPASARREHGRRLRADRRRARAAHARRAARGRDRRSREDDDRVPHAAPLPRRVRATARCRSTRSSTRSPSGRADAGLLIHEGQLTYGAHGLQKVVDLGEWWLLETGLPLPLGVNVARRDLGPRRAAELSAVLAASIRAGLDNRERGLEYALQFGPRPRRRARRPLRRHVRERADLGLRRGGPPRRPRAAPARRGARRLRRTRRVEFVSIERMLTLLALLAGAAPGPHATLSAPPRPLISGRVWNATLVVKPAPLRSPSIVARPPSGRSFVFRARRAGRGKYKVRMV